MVNRVFANISDWPGGADGEVGDYGQQAFPHGFRRSADGEALIEITGEDEIGVPIFRPEYFFQTVQASKVILPRAPVPPSGRNVSVRPWDADADDGNLTHGRCHTAADEPARGQGR